MPTQDLMLFRERIHRGRHRRSNGPRDRRRRLTHPINGSQRVL